MGIIGGLKVNDVLKKLQLKTFLKDFKSLKMCFSLPGIADQVSVPPEVHGRVHEGQHVGHQTIVLDRYLVPGGLESPDDHVVQAGHDGKH